MRYAYNAVPSNYINRPGNGGKMKRKVARQTTARAETRSPGRPPVYNWDKLTAKPKRTLVQGQDFGCSPNSMRQQIYTNARRRGLHAAVKINGNTVEVRFVENAKAASGQATNMVAAAR